LGQGVLFVIDEAHLALGQYTKKEVTEFLSLHRHYGFDIYLLTQNHAKINKDVRAMIENSYNCAKMEAYGQTGYNRKTFHGLPSRDFIAMEQREYDPSIFPYYKSHTASVGSVVEAKAKGGGAILNPYKKVTIVFITLGVFALIFVGSKVFSSDEKQIITKTLEKPVVMNNQNQINDLVLNEPISAELKKDIKPKIVTAPMSTSQEIFEEKRNNSEKYHPFRKVQLHVDGIYWDDEQSVRNVYFSASTNGQKMFDVTLKELILSGYTVNVLGDCIVELLYFDYQEFIMCDVPKVSTGQTNVAQN
jgi:zona occludens toxin